MSVFQRIIQVGQRVSCSLSHAGQGTVIEIIGEQNPSSCRNIARSVGVAGGRAHFHIVWDNGNRSQGVPESLLRGSIQWRVFDEVYSPEAVERAKHHAAHVERQRSAAKAEAERTYQAEKAALDADPELACLARIENGADDSKIAAANVRKLLRKHFKGVKFSVRKGSYDSFTVRWTDGPTKREVNAIVERFKAGQFDGMDDSYNYRRTPWTDLFGSVKYVFVARAVSDALVSRAIESIWELYAANVATLDKPTPDALLREGYGNTVVPGLSQTLGTLVRLELVNMQG